MNPSTSSSLVIGDGKFPWNLRPLRAYSERACFVVSMAANTVLIVLLTRESNPTIKPYSRVLLLNAVFDYAYTIVSIVVEMELEMNQGTYIFVVNGLPTALSSHWQRFFVGLWMSSIASTCAASIVEFIFRYLHVVREYTLGYISVFAMGVGVALIGAQNGLLIYLAISSVEDHVATCGDLMMDPMWFEDGKQAVFFCADKHNMFLQLFLFSASVYDTIIVTVLLLSTLSTLRTLERNRESMSANVRYMQSQLNRLMFSEVITLTTVFVMPVGIAMAFLILSVQWVGFGVLLAIFLECDDDDPPRRPLPQAITSLVFEEAQDR